MRRRRSSQGTLTLYVSPASMHMYEAERNTFRARYIWVAYCLVKRRNEQTGVTVESMTGLGLKAEESQTSRACSSARKSSAPNQNSWLLGTTAGDSTLTQFRSLLGCDDSRPMVVNNGAKVSKSANNAEGLSGSPETTTYSSSTASSLTHPYFYQPYFS